ncbi:hypothetical protein OS493_003930 [Desmophyllum pertusum]|uniref:Uncharacterized protein n=1 Tax=Desmophyllum pertusum TaxID=174260 RepID=A0A9X0D609_9CNID|nr:hypothetical protein OS493_003930 [Desmophyllum pertusum]
MMANLVTSSEQKGVIATKIAKLTKRVWTCALNTFTLQRSRRGRTFHYDVTPDDVHYTGFFSLAEKVLPNR